MGKETFNAQLFANRQHEAIYPIDLTNIIRDGGFDGWRVELFNRRSGQREYMMRTYDSLAELTARIGPILAERSAIFTRVAPSREVPTW